MQAHACSKGTAGAKTAVFLFIIFALAEKLPEAVPE
jgi:hypothetical protein